MRTSCSSAMPPGSLPIFPCPPPRRWCSPSTTRTSRSRSSVPCWRARLATWACWAAASADAASSRFCAPRASRRSGSRACRSRSDWTSARRRRPRSRSASLRRSWRCAAGGRALRSRSERREAHADREGHLPPAGAVLAQNVLGSDGRVVLEKGAVLGAEELQRLSELPWTELHVIELETGDVHEEEAGRRLSAALAGDGVGVEALSAGAFPLVARHRGVLDYDPALLARLNEIDDLAVYARPPGSITREGERIGGAKIIPFVTRQECLTAAEGIAAGGLLRVRRFLPVRVAVLVEDSVEERVLSRARRALEEKLAFFGSDLALVERVPMATDAVTDALRGALRSGAELIVLAGGNPMDPLDPALLALERAGARMEKHGIPAQPGTLLWLAYAGAVPRVGAPSCGLFAKATALDLLLPPLLTGERLSRAAVAAMGAGGLITTEVAWRLPPYRAGSPRGQLDPE